MSVQRQFLLLSREHILAATLSRYLYKEYNWTGHTVMNRAVVLYGYHPKFEYFYIEAPPKVFHSSHESFTSTVIPIFVK